MSEHSGETDHGSDGSETGLDREFEVWAFSDGSSLDDARASGGLAGGLQ